MIPSYFLAAAISDGVAVQLITSLTSLAAIVLGWLVQKTWRRGVNRKTGRAHPSRINDRLVLIASVALGVLLSAAAFWYAWGGGRGLSSVQGVAMVWVGLLGAVVQVLACGVGIAVIRAFSTYTVALGEHTEILNLNYENQRLLALSLKTITERQEEILSIKQFPPASNKEIA